MKNANTVTAATTTILRTQSLTYNDTNLGQRRKRKGRGTPYCSAYESDSQNHYWNTSSAALLVWSSTWLRALSLSILRHTHTKTEKKDDSNKKLFKKKFLRRSCSQRSTLLWPYLYNYAALCSSFLLVDTYISTNFVLASSVQYQHRHGWGYFPLCLLISGELYL